MNRKIKTVTVVGANGTMGANVSAIFASFGNAKVYMVSRDMDKSRKAVAKAVKSVRAQSIAANLIPADYSMLSACVAESDLVFESTAENPEIKKDITKRIAGALGQNTIVCSGTSGLSVTMLAECIPEAIRGNYLGMHFFNPPYNMPLCELIPTKYTEPEVLKEAKTYLSEVLYRTVVEIKDAPAFLANRIGFQFINEAMQYAQRYQDRGGIDYVDGILGSFTGRAMAPLTTADFVGLDVHKAIVDNLYANTCDYAHSSFVLPSFCQELIDAGLLGRKAGAGLYKMQIDENGKKNLQVYDIATRTFRPKTKYAFPFAQEMNRLIRNGEYQAAFRALLDNTSDEAKICLEFLLKYIVYSLNNTAEVGFCIHACDDVMATGFNWCPPLAMAGAFAEVADFAELVKTRLDGEILSRVDIDRLLSGMVPSQYDYRPYFKAAR